MKLFVLLLGICFCGNLCQSAQEPFNLYLLKATNCLQDKSKMLFDIRYNASIPSPNSHNYYVVLADITKSMNLTIGNNMYRKDKNWKLIPSLSGKTINYCEFLKNDIAVMPKIRMFMKASITCPVVKGKYPVIKNKLVSVFSPITMPGCWKLNFEWFDSNKNIIACVSLVFFQSKFSEEENDRNNCY